MSKFLTDSSSAWKNAWSKGNIGNSISSVASGVTGVASAFGENSRLNDSKINSIQNQIDDISNTQFGYGDYDSLQGSFINPQVQDFSAYSLGKTDGEKVIGTLKGAASGAMAGASVGGPVGAIVGGAIGIGSGIISGLFGSNKAKREAERLEQEASDARNMYLANFANNAEQISRNKFNTAALNLAAFGGMLKNNNIDNFTKSRVRLHAFGGDMFSPLGREDGFSNGVVKINEGGTHETNPNDGVLMGVDPAGTPNLVEQGEVLFNDYVFSNRLYPTGGQLESVRLPKRYEGKSYSDIAWDLQKESELNPLDAISKNTLIDSMAKLTTLQEESRERDREYQAFDNLEQVFADGGSIHIKPSKRGTFTALATRKGMSLNQLSSDIDAHPNKYSPEARKKNAFYKGIVKGGHAFGGPMGNMYPDGSQLRTFRAPKVTLNLKDTFKLPEEKETDITSSTNEMFDNQNRWLDDFGNYYWGKHNIDESDKRHNRLLGEAADYANGYMGYGWFNGNSLAQKLRAVPVIGSAINAIGDASGWRNKEDYTWSDRIGDATRIIRDTDSSPIGGYMAYNPYDVDYEMNRLQNVGLGTQRALLDTAGGNSLAARNAMLALNNNIAGQMGEARRGAAAANEERRKGVQQFNAGIDQFNAGQSLNSQIYNQRADEERVDDIIRQAMLADSIQSATSQARSTEETAALNNAGQWGNDMMYNDMARYYLEHIAPNNDATRDASWILGRRYGAKGGKIKKSNIKEFKKK